MEELSRSTEKTQQIIQAAQNLFGFYGFEKVTMNEIADELNISKASLYYYFPDKENLCMAVLEKEKTEFIAKISTLLDKKEKPEQMLKEYSILRLEYLRRFLNLGRLRQETYSKLKPVFKEVITKFREKEVDLIKKIIEMGVSTGVFSVKDAQNVASLFLDLLKGLGASIVKHEGIMMFEKNEFDTLLQKTGLFTDIFINGLKVNLK